MNLRTVFTTFVAALGLMGVTASSLADAPKTAATEMLFVQSATGGSYDGKTLTLTGAPSTIFFSDRPKRVVGHVSTGRFIDHWANGKDSFKADAPNAVLSILDGDGTNNSTIELSDPQVNGDQVSYQVKLLDGKPPAEFKTASLFIDGAGVALLGGLIAGSVLTNMANN